MASFGRYDVVDKLGEGAMGVVYRARDTALGRIVALKMLSAELGAEEELHQRFQREAEAIGRLSHPSIVTVYDLGEADGQLYMAMELLEGTDLRELLAKGKLTALEDKLAMMEQILDGLAFAHAKGVMHRDLKPGNIHVLPNRQIKIMDFGLARRAQDAGGARRRRAHGAGSAAAWLRSITRRNVSPRAGCSMRTPPAAAGPSAPASSTTRSSIGTRTSSPSIENRFWPR